MPCFPPARAGVRIVLALILAVAGAGRLHAEKEGDWEQVWKAVQELGKQEEPVPPEALEDGPPVRIGDRVLFRFHAPESATQVHLAGSFNSWAQNNSGRIKSERFAMREAGGGRWFRWADLSPGEHAYQYVVANGAGGFDWQADPHAERRDAEGHSILVLPATEPAAAGPARSFLETRFAAGSEPVPALRAEKVWVRPGEPNAILLPPSLTRKGGELVLEIRTPLGEVVHTSRHQPAESGGSLTVPPLTAEGGYLATLSSGGRIVGEAVLSVVDNVADDLRYGFYASYGKAGGDYAARADMLAALHVNAVEFYDYFQAHGRYAPTERHYKFEPFGIEIDAEDVRRKIDAGHDRNILAIAYVAAYAASQSVYDEHPHPMTDVKGEPKVFNGEIMTEREADEQGKPKWFRLMNIAGDSPWHKYIMGEFARTLDDKPEDLVSFDGFEIDTYGDLLGSKFHASGSKRDGEPLADVLRDFVRDVRDVTRSVKPHGLVSFNSINEFGSAEMVDVTDFPFMEIWRFYTAELTDIVDICLRHRAPRHQRVVLKLYPADMDPKQTSWPAGTLARLLGATMTGGGSLMVVGEPDEENRTMHGLNSLFYPDHKPLRSGNSEMVAAYYGHDAMLLGYTHGRNVHNTPLRADFPESITRTFAAPDRRALVVQILRAGENRRWTADVPLPEPKRDGLLTMPLPGGAAPREVFFASPDSNRFRHPMPAAFETSGDTLKVNIPELSVHGTVIIRY
jgi:hypothetical protein